MLRHCRMCLKIVASINGCSVIHSFGSYSYFLQTILWEEETHIKMSTSRDPFRLLNKANFVRACVCACLCACVCVCALMGAGALGKPRSERVDFSPVERLTEKIRINSGSHLKPSYCSKKTQILFAYLFSIWADIQFWQLWQKKWNILLEKGLQSICKSDA